MTLPELLVPQSGVVARRQLHEVGLAPHDVRRMIRRRELVRVRAGVYVAHNGELTWLQRAWVEVLNAWPAALSHQSALRAAGGPGRMLDDRAPLHIAVGRTRSIEQPGGVRLHRLADLSAKVQWNQSPPRIRVEHAVIDVAAEAADEHMAINALADVVQRRLTQVDRIREALVSRSRIARREFLLRVLTDIEDGTCSVLEHGYLERVERAHGLPVARRQSRTSGRATIYRDVEYAGYGTLVELDGRLFHDSARSRDADLDRDLDARVDGQVTARLGWGQVYGRPCVTARKIGELLQQHGWSGVVGSCPACR